jgi:hypothetical protein
MRHNNFIFYVDQVRIHLKFNIYFLIHYLLLLLISYHLKFKTLDIDLDSQGRIQDFGQGINYRIVIIYWVQTH